MMNDVRCNPYAKAMIDQENDKKNSSKHDPLVDIKKLDEKEDKEAAAAKAKKASTLAQHLVQ